VGYKCPDACWKYLPYRDSTPGPSSQYEVFIPVHATTKFLVLPSDGVTAFDRAKTVFFEILPHPSRTRKPTIVPLLSDVLISC
jgi:hypothetical protein